MRILLALALLPALWAQNPNSAIFPGGTAGDGDLFVATNFASTTLNGGINNSTTSVVLTSATLFVAPVIITVDTEIMHCASLAMSTLTCTRGQEGTSAASHSSGATVYGYNTAWHHNQIAAEVKAVETQLANVTSYNCTFTSVNSKACVHNLNTTHLHFDCWDASGAPVWKEAFDSVVETDANTLTFTFADTESGHCDIGIAGPVGGLIGGQKVVSYSATPAFDLSLGWMQKITLTGDVTSSTVSNQSAGVPYTFEICQDATGGRAFVWPTSFHGSMTIGSTASECSVQTFVYDSDGSKFVANTVGVINQ